MEGKQPGARRRLGITTKKLVTVALMAALQVVLSKFLMIQAGPSVRFSVDAAPILLAGVWFGPLWGAITGVLGDALGTMLFPTAGAWYPPLTVGYALIGMMAGGLRTLLPEGEKPVLGRVLLLAAGAEMVGSLLWKTQALRWLTGLSFAALLSGRLLPVAVNTAAEGLILFAVLRAVGLRPPQEARPRGTAAPMTYDEALAYIHSVDWRGSSLGVKRMGELMARLGDPHKELKFVHVAGTNGKGSTSEMIASVLSAGGYRTGLYISPYINRFNERIQVNGEEIPDGALASITERIKAAADAMADHPTEFEMVTALGMVYFHDRACDIVVLEVGLGGRLDATNVIDAPELAVITAIGLDHTKILGDTLGQIAFEKAGIIKPGCPVVSYGHNPQADEVIRQVCLEKDARLVTADFARVRDPQFSLERLEFTMEPYGLLTLGLVGEYQLHNAALAVTALETLQERGWRITPESIRAGLAQARWPARFEVLSREPLFLVDGGHNPQGVAAAVKSFQTLFPGRKAVFLLGIMADKDVSRMLELIRPVAERFVTCTPNNPRATPAEALAKELAELGCEAEAADSVAQGVARARELAGAEGVAFALGSLYMAGDVRDCFMEPSQA